MTGICCKQDHNCEFYRAAYITAFNNPVINVGDKYTCDAINWFKEAVAKGPAKLSEDSLKKFREGSLECVVLENLNKNKQF